MHMHMHSVFGAHAQLYYPVELVDWWMDDWITNVYGRARTQKVHIQCTRHTMF